MTDDTANGSHDEAARPIDAEPVTERPTEVIPDAPAVAESKPTDAADRPATGTVYTPGQPPQPYHAAEYRHDAQSAAATPHQAPENSAAQPAQPQPAQQHPTQPTHPAPQPSYASQTQPTQPTQPLGGAVPPAFGGPGPAVASADQPKRRVGLGVAAAIVAAALIGGASGAGINALITSGDDTGRTESSSNAQNIVVNDTDSVNQITAVAAAASPSVVTLSVSGGQGAGTGSGVILSEDGYVLTNTHVVTLDGATASPEIQVKTDEGRIFAAELIGTDPLSDLAVIKLADASGLTPIEFADSEALDVGDAAIAIGAPLGLAGTVTNGIVSALNRSIDVASSAAPQTPDDGQGEQGEGEQEQGDLPFWFDIPGEEGEAQAQVTGQISIPVIQTDAAINPGNSGGALLDAEGRLIGINVAILSAGGSQGEAGNIGVGFAVPSNLAQRVANEIIENGAATHGLLGANVRAAAAEEGAENVGAYIQDVTPDGAAAAAGLEAGDVVVEFNGVPITDQSDLTAQVRALPGGASAELTYLRGGEESTTTVTLGTFEG